MHLFIVLSAAFKDSMAKNLDIIVFLKFLDTDITFFPIVLVSWTPVMVIE